MKFVAIENSGERTRLACWRWRPRRRELFLPAENRRSLRDFVSAMAPKRAREARALLNQFQCRSTK